MNDVSIPGWAWAIIGGAVLLMLAIIGYLISDMISRYRNDVKVALDATKAIKQTTCSFHQDSFRRVHEEREAGALALQGSIAELNKNIARLETSTSNLSIHIENISEKHQENKAQIEFIDGRLRIVEGRIAAG